MVKYICKVLLEGSIDAAYDENTLILDDLFNIRRFNTFQELIDTSTKINVYSKKYEKHERRKRSSYQAFFSFFE